MKLHNASLIHSVVAVAFEMVDVDELLERVAAETGLDFDDLLVAIAELAKLAGEAPHITEEDRP